MVSCAFPSVEPGIGRDFLACGEIRRCGVGWFADGVFKGLLLDIKKGKSATFPVEWSRGHRKGSAHHYSAATSRWQQWTYLYFT